jgi:hypothetical protein
MEVVTGNMPTIADKPTVLYPPPL